MPWLLARRVIAANWGIPPPDVDQYPAFEIENELALMQLEGEAQG